MRGANIRKNKVAVQNKPRWWVYLLAVVVFVFTIFPFYWIITTSLKMARDIYKTPPVFFPQQITLQNYVTAFTTNHIGTFVLNSIIVAVPSVIISILIAVLGAYAISHFEFKGKRLIQAGLLSTQFFPIIVILIPMFILCKVLSLYNTYTGLILPNIAIQVPISMLLLINYFADIPKEIEEAAEIDGCNRMQNLFKVIFPLTLPGVTATAIYIFVQVWQEFLIASSFISNADKFTLTVGLSTFQSLHTTDWGGLMATSVVIALPTLLLFSSAQKYFINNLAAGVKG